VFVLIPKLSNKSKIKIPLIPLPPISLPPDPVPFVDPAAGLSAFSAALISFKAF
jgi:hypothetical protein